MASHLSKKGKKICPRKAFRSFWNDTEKWVFWKSRIPVICMVIWSLYDDVTTKHFLGKIFYFNWNRYLQRAVNIFRKKKWATWEVERLILSLKYWRKILDTKKLYFLANKRGTSTNHLSYWVSFHSCTGFNFWVEMVKFFWAMARHLSQKS